MSYYNYSPQGDYARLGSTCSTNMNVLVSNSKFIPLNDPVYKLYYTQTEKLPGPSIEIKSNKSEEHKKSKESSKSCCNKESYFSTRETTEL